MNNIDKALEILEENNTKELYKILKDGTKLYRIKVIRPKKKTHGYKKTYRWNAEFTNGFQIVGAGSLSDLMLKVLNK
jgi:hypothetical protein